MNKIMKLSNIFTINTSTGGGKRLFKKIIDKYNLGNEYKQIKENIENSYNNENSQEGFSNKYYIFKEGTPNSLIEEIITLGCVIKLYIGGDICIYPYTIAVGLSSTDKKYLGVSFTPFYGELNGEKQFVQSIEDYVIKIGGDIQTIITNSILELTQEEFYKID